jgi:5-methyltetrahydrofolate--homocysteine methyltransferase
MTNFEQLQQLVITGQKDKVKDVVSDLLKKGFKPMDIISQGLIGGMNTVGARFKAGDMFIPEVMFSSHAMKEGMDQLKPLILGDASKSFYTGKVVIGTVQGDLHHIGKNIVAMLLESSGFQVIDLGVDVANAMFIEAVKKEKPDIVGMSALLTPTVPRMKDVIEALKEAGLRDKVFVMIGGAPVSQATADSVGADAYAPEAQSAVEKAKALLSKKKK